MLASVIFIFLSLTLHPQKGGGGEVDDKMLNLSLLALNAEKNWVNLDNENNNNNVIMT